jgi:hypothetical protein
MNGLPFISVVLTHHHSQIKLDNILLDTGSAGTIFSIDNLSTINILPNENDKIHRIRGVGGVEYVFEKIIDIIEVGDLKLENFPIEIGQVNYGFNIQGILGVNFLKETNATINFEKLKLK